MARTFVSILLGSVLALAVPPIPLAAGLQGAQEDDQLRQELGQITELISRTLAERAPRWRCQPTVRFDCSLKGCTEAKPTVWLNVDFSARRYERCDSKGCDEHQMTHSASGIFTVVSVGGGSTLFKVVNDGSEFMEVASLGTAAYTSFGRCAPR